MNIFTEKKNSEMKNSGQNLTSTHPNFHVDVLTINIL